jgi:hypothetical protein
MAYRQLVFALPVMNSAGYLLVRMNYRTRAVTSVMSLH